MYTHYVLLWHSSWRQFAYNSNSYQSVVLQLMLMVSMVVLVFSVTKQVPTTVMGVVDASIGIKTAVNFHEKKNKLGTYCPPLGVLYDTSFLQTLDSRHISNGSAEILKMACIKDRELFDLMDKNAEHLIGDKFQVWW